MTTVIRQQYVYFSELPIKAEFYRNGNLWIKRSSRTAYLPEYDRWFYFREKDLCIVGNHDRVEF